MMEEKENGHDNPLERMSSSTEVIEEEGVDAVNSKTSVNSSSSSSYVSKDVYRDDWYKLLFQDGYLNVLKEYALSGELQGSNIRAICWKVFLGVLPEDQSQWIDQITKSRQFYNELKTKHLVDPHGSVESSLDLSKNNPLSLEDDSPWNLYFQDSGLKEFIQQDIVRTHPDQQFFRQDSIQTAMLNILFCYAKEYPHVSYRQGMHELLAPMLFVLHAEDRGDITSDSSIRDELKVVMDPNYIEHDAFSLFSELMEGMQQFYLNATLESDFAMARDRKLANMKYDPRKATPFESKEILAPTSAIARKLDKIHEVILKRTDEQLYYRLQQLGIPPQTYGIRWLRLLFSREFLLPSVLELWDALFSEGSSLSLVDYFFVVMLMQFRDKMLSSDYSTCMQLLMQYPVMFEVPDLVHNALHLKNPVQYPIPIRVVREWTTLDGEDLFQPLHIQEPIDEPVVTDNSDTKKRAQNFASKVLSSSKNAITSKQIHLPTKLQISSHKNSSNTKIPKTTPTVTTPRERPMSPKQKEMIVNPKTRPVATMNDVDRVKEQLDNNEAKCLYCGRKMESILDQLQSCIDETIIPEDKQDTVFLGLAGLKQIRDLLLHKLPFSGELADYELLTAPVVEEDDEWYTEDSNKPTDVSTDIKPTTTNSIQEEELIPEATTLSSAEHASEQ